MKNIEALIADGGDITIGAIYPIKCAATAADSHNTVATLVRRENESLNALLKRLDKAIGKFYADDEIVRNKRPLIQDASSRRYDWPLTDCGGVDAVMNMQWLPDQIKSQRGEFSKDHFERRIYGGNGLSKGCP